jgi:hypothetical protein
MVSSRDLILYPISIGLVIVFLFLNLFPRDITIKLLFALIVTSIIFVLTSFASE